MILTDDDSRLIEIVRRLESKKCRDDIVYQAEAMVRAQEALKEDYGLTGQRQLPKQTA
jgi:hypothetical protein